MGEAFSFVGGDESAAGQLAGVIEKQLAVVSAAQLQRYRAVFNQARQLPVYGNHRAVLQSRAGRRVGVERPPSSNAKKEIPNKI